MTIIGLNNIGNTCYLNSVSQVLLNCTYFIDILMGINTDNEILNLLKKFIYEYKTSNTSISPINMKRVINKYSQFEGFDQHDANEFLVYLLDLVDTELKKENIDIVSKFFDHKYYTKIENTINNDDEKILKFNERILNLPMSNNLNDSYTLYCKVEIIDEWESEKYKTKVIARKKNIVYQWPIYLTIMFKKYTNNLFKLDDDIEIPIIWKIMNVFNKTKEIITYQFVGAIIHFGNLYAGHYICVIYKDNKFYLCNDSSIYEIDTDKANELINKAYMIIYCKK